MQYEVLLPAQQPYHILLTAINIVMGHQEYKQNPSYTSIFSTFQSLDSVYKMKN